MQTRRDEFEVQRRNHDRHRNDGHHDYLENRFNYREQGNGHDNTNGTYHLGRKLVVEFANPENRRCKQKCGAVAVAN